MKNTSYEHGKLFDVVRWFYAERCEITRARQTDQVSEQKVVGWKGDSIKSDVIELTIGENRIIKNKKKTVDINLMVVNSLFIPPPSVFDALLDIGNNFTRR